ncbi:hypothetical protein [Actinoallomurus soli]|uniref:hypothetical protein n=1 Tax=Actinoallomurus soli TaxID=2952535 RepID=UPI0020926F67|nr:hypothetical protein [Actinoallomurus soli]MCO5967379.1 hypothetical protein [Actinoallomurus soli]
MSDPWARRRLDPARVGRAEPADEAVAAQRGGEAADPGLVALARRPEPEVRRSVQYGDRPLHEGHDTT